MSRPHPRSTLKDTLFPYPTLFRSAHPALLVGQRDAQAWPRVHAAARGFPADGLGLALGGALRRGFEAAMIAVGGRDRRAGNGLQRGGGDEKRQHQAAITSSTARSISAISGSRDRRCSPSFFKIGRAHV